MIIERFAFLPPNPPNELEKNDILFKSYEIISLKTSNQDTIPALFIKKKNSVRVLLYSHGNAEDLGSLVSFITQLSKNLNVSILAYEYLGYGFSQTNKNIECTYQQNPYPSEEGCYKSIMAAYRYLTHKLHYHHSNIILIGQSIGCGPTVELATQKPVGGVILISPFKTAIKIMYDYWYLNPLYWMDIFTNEYKICKIVKPILFIHGTQDKIINVYHTSDLYNILKNYYQKNNIKNYYEVQYIEGADHNDIWSNYNILDIIISFIQKI